MRSGYFAAMTRVVRHLFSSVTGSQFEISMKFKRCVSIVANFLG
jgi:hypothetical protein